MVTISNVKLADTQVGSLATITFSNGMQLACTAVFYQPEHHNLIVYTPNKKLVHIAIGSDYACTVLAENVRM